MASCRINEYVRPKIGSKRVPKRELVLVAKDDLYNLYRMFDDMRARVAECNRDLREHKKAKTCLRRLLRLVYVMNIRLSEASYNTKSAWQAVLKYLQGDGGFQEHVTWLKQDLTPTPTNDTQDPV